MSSAFGGTDDRQHMPDLAQGHPAANRAVSRRTAHTSLASVSDLLPRAVRPIELQPLEAAVLSDGPRGEAAADLPVARSPLANAPAHVPRLVPASRGWCRLRDPSVEGKSSYPGVDRGEHDILTGRR